jgi:hypothetical protein
VLVVEPPELGELPTPPPEDEVEGEADPEGDGEPEEASLSASPESVLGEPFLSSADSEELTSGVKVSPMMPGWVADTMRRIKVVGTTTRLETNIHLFLVHASSIVRNAGKDFTQPPCQNLDQVLSKFSSDSSLSIG